MAGRTHQWSGLRDGDTVAFSTTATRRKALNLVRDPRIRVTVFDTANPYHSVEIRGTAELAEDTARSLQKAVSHKYLGEDSPPEPPQSGPPGRPGEAGTSHRLLGLTKTASW